MPDAVPKHMRFLRRLLVECLISSSRDTSKGSTVSKHFFLFLAVSVSYEDSPAAPSFVRARPVFEINFPSRRIILIVGILNDTFATDTLNPSLHVQLFTKNYVI